MKTTFYSLLMLSAVQMVNAQEVEKTSFGLKTTVSQQHSQTSKKENTVWVQEEDRTGDYLYSTVNSRFDGANFGIYVANDFEITEKTNLKKLVFYMSHDSGDFYDKLLGYNVRFYKDVNGNPEGQPNSSEFSLISLVDLKHTDPSVLIEPGLQAFMGYKVLTIDLEKLEGDFSLEPGKYWIAFYTNMDVPEHDLDYRSVWVQSSDDYQLEPAKMIDATGTSNLPIQNWTPIHTVGMPMKSVAFIIYGDKTMAINEIKNNKVSIYPNPVVNELTIQTKNGVKIHQVTIYDLMGRKVLSTQKVTGKLNLDSLKSGNYVVEIQSSEGITTQKLIKK